MQNIKMQIEGAPLGAPFLKVKIADTFFTRLAGLMFQKKLPQGSGLLLVPCNSVHMCFMRFSIDVIYLDKDYKIIEIVKNLQPWIGLSLYFPAWATLEVTASDAERCGLAVGKKLLIQEIDDLVNP